LSSYAVVKPDLHRRRLYYDREADLIRVAAVARDKAALVAAEKGAEKTAEKVPATGGEAKPARRRPPEAHVVPPVPATLTTSAWSLAPLIKVKPPVGTLAIVNARIHPVTAPAVERGTVLVQDGLITGVGQGVAIPPGTKIIDAAGRTSIPGGSTRAPPSPRRAGPRGYQDTDEMLDFNPQLRTVVAYHSDSESIPWREPTASRRWPCSRRGGCWAGRSRS